MDPTNRPSAQADALAYRPVPPHLPGMDVSTRILFDPSGIDWDDDQAIDRWAQAVWTHLTRERGRTHG